MYSLLIDMVGLMIRYNLAKSKGEAKRLIAQGAVREDDIKVGEEALVVPGSVVKVGKRKYLRIADVSGKRDSSS